MSRPRTPVAAQEAGRAACVRACQAAADGELHLLDMRVFTALHALVTGYDRVEDYVANRQIVQLSGVDARNVRRALERLAKHGVIRREPGSSMAGQPRRASLISFDPQMVLAVDTPAEGAPDRGRPRPPTPVPGVPGPRVHRPRDRGSRGPASEVLSDGTTASARATTEHAAILNILRRIYEPDEVEAAYTSLVAEGMDRDELERRLREVLDEPPQRPALRVVP